MTNYLYYTFLFFYIPLFLLGCTEKSPHNQFHQKKHAESFPKFKFDKVEHDFGKIVAGKVVRKVFHFTNIGNKPLIISNATATCGCTLAKYPKNQPIAPKEKGQITVEFDSKEKQGQQNKTVLIYSNVKGKQTKLKIYAMVHASK